VEESKMRILICVVLVLVGCNPDTTEPRVRKADYHPDIKYHIVEVEGKKWIATPGSHGEWSLAGPLE
jgi:hypothetical protein